MSDDLPDERVPWEDLDDHDREQFAAMVAEVGVDIDDVDDAKQYYGDRERLKQAAREQSDNPRMVDPPEDDEEGPPSFFRAGPMLMPVPDHADRSEPLEPPSFDEYGSRCPECDANEDPWVGDDVVAVSVDTAIIDGSVSIVAEAECTCGWHDRAVIQ